MKASVMVSVFALLIATIQLNPELSSYRLNGSLQQTLHANVEGMVTVDGKPHGAVIEIYSMNKNLVVDKVSCVEKTGSFKTNLLKGDEYELIVKVPNFPPQQLILSTKNIQNEKTINVFADFTSPGYDHKLEDLKKSVDEKYRQQFKQAKFEEKYGHITKENLVYKIQVGAFKFYENFNYTPLINLPKIIRKVDNDFITRFTMGNYGTYAEAAVILKKVQACDLKEAFIVAYYNGERKMLSQLLSEKILE